MAKKSQTVKVARSAENGRFVTLEYAKRHPRTSVIESIKRPRK